MMQAEHLAELFHVTYEELAPQYGYETRKESAVPWHQVPEQNKQLMIAVAREVLAYQQREVLCTVHEETQIRLTVERQPSDHDDRITIYFPAEGIDEHCSDEQIREALDDLLKRTQYVRTGLYL